METNTPKTPVSRNKNRAIYALIFSSIPNEARITSGVRIVVNKIIGIDMPSTPIWKEEPIAGNHGARISNWKPFV